MFSLTIHFVSFTTFYIDIYFLLQINFVRFYNIVCIYIYFYVFSCNKVCQLYKRNLEAGVKVHLFWECLILRALIVVMHQLNFILIFFPFFFSMSPHKPKERKGKHKMHSAFQNTLPFVEAKFCLIMCPPDKL